MLTFFLNLFGAKVDSASRIADWQFMLRGAGYGGWIFLIAAVLGVMIVISYRRTEHLPRWRRYLLAGLRTAFILLILLMLMQPIIRFTVEGTVRRMLLVMVDDSSSMKIEDPRTDPADLKRSAIAKNLLDPEPGLDQKFDATKNPAIEHPSRVDLVKAVMQNDRMSLLPRLARGYDLRTFAMGETVTSLDAPAASASSNPKPDTQNPTPGFAAKLTAASPVTPIGDGVRDLLARSRGQPLAGIWLVTDGQSNRGTLPLSAAEMAKNENVPLYIWGVGLTSPKDIVVASVFAQEVCFVKDEVLVAVRVRAGGLSGESAKLELKFDGRVVDQKDVTFGGDAEQVVAMKFTPEQPGDYEIVASIAPRADEAVKDNNSASQRLRVIDGKIKVLLVERSPRWEFKYLQAMLARDRRVEARWVLAEADPALSRAENSPYLPQFPASKEELFKFDLVILGDIDPQSLDGSQVENLGEFVSKFGGGLLVIAGRKYGPGAFKGTVIEKMLPVEIDAGIPGEVGTTAGDQAIKLELTAAGQRSTMLRLSDVETESASLWAKLPLVYWMAKVARAKPAAEVFVVDADPSRTGRVGGKMPVMALQQYGLGQVMFVGTDNTWRWRRNGGDENYTMLWGQIVQRLSLPKLLGESKRTQLSSDRKNYVTGDRVTIYARLYNESYAPIVEPDVRGVYEIGGKAAGEVSLRPLPEQPGMYRGEFVAPAAGSYQFHVSADEKTKLDISVAEPRVELGETSMNEMLLRQMAETSGGKFFREEDLYNLPDAIKAKSDTVQSKLEVDLWSSPIYFILMIAIVSAEWIVRKMSQLK